MKLTKSQLKQIIKEELESNVNEDMDSSYTELREAKEILLDVLRYLRGEENYDAASALDRAIQELEAAMSHVRS
jgi:DNA-directed RNA polymerase subunit F